MGTAFCRYTAVAGAVLRVHRRIALLHAPLDGAVYCIPGTRRSKSTPVGSLAVHASLHCAVALPSPGDLPLHFFRAAPRAVAHPKPHSSLRCTTFTLGGVTPPDGPAGRAGPVHRGLTRLPAPGPPQPPLSGLSDPRAAGGAASAIPRRLCRPCRPPSPPANPAAAGWPQREGRNPQKRPKSAENG